MQIEDWQWREEQKKVFLNNIQAHYEKEFEQIKEKLLVDLKTKDKGTMRNINNYRMKLWCDMFIEYKKQSHERNLAASCASKDLEMFDIKFNQ